VQKFQSICSILIEVRTTFSLNACLVCYSLPIPYRYFGTRKCRSHNQHFLKPEAVLTDSKHSPSCFFIVYGPNSRNYICPHVKLPSEHLCRHLNNQKTFAYFATCIEELTSGVQGLNSLSDPSFLCCC
jgi:hypothetical protein